MDAEILFLAIFVGVLLYFAYSIIRNRGFRGAMFGAPVVSSLGEVSIARRGFGSQKLKVHILGGESPSDRSVGLELTSFGPGSFSMTPIRLSLAEVRTLIGLLEKAIDPSIPV